MKVLKKLSVGGVCGLTKEAIKVLVDAAGGAEVFVGRFVGICRNVETKDTEYGPALKFVGEFRGLDAHGEESYAPVAYLPNPFDELLSDQINEIRGADGQAKVNVEFGLDVYAVPYAKGVGYKFICRPLKEAAPSNPLAALMQSFAPLVTLPKPDAAPALGHDTPEPETEAPASKAKAGK